MSDDFRKPFAAPPTIFGVALMLSIPLGFLLPYPLLPVWAQIPTGIVTIAAGVLLIRSSMQSINSAETTYDPFAASTALVTTGIYRYTRNPGYLGLAVIQFGFALLFDNLWIGLATIVAMWVTTQYVIKLEEEKLTDTFGQDYVDYRHTVRRWL